MEGRRSPVARDRLLGLFWPDSDEGRARNRLSQALHHLRQALGPDVLESQGAVTVGVRAEALWCDATAFAHALERGEVELALDLYRGEFCPSLFGSGAPELEHWLDGQRQQLKAEALGAAVGHATACMESGAHAGAARAARRGLAIGPDDEHQVRTLLTLLERAGDAAGALDAYQSHARRLAATLETEPEPETRQLVESIRRRQAAIPPSPERILPPVAATPDPVPPSPSSPLNRRRRGLIAALAFGLGLVALVGLMWRGRDHAEARAHAVAVLPFTLRAGANLAYLGDGMVDLLSAKLGDVSGFQVIDPRRVIAAADKERREDSSGAGLGARVARRVGASWYITGDVIEVAGRLQLVGTLHDAGEGRRAPATVSVLGDTASLFELVDDLTGRMLAGLLGGRDTTLTRLAAVTTRSLPALKAFLAGERALREGQEAQAAASFREAVQLDSTFALAQYRLALAATWVTVRGAEDPTVWAATAARHAERLTPLGRDLVNAYLAYREVRGDEAERRYLEITREHPDNVDAWLMLGETRFHYGPFLGRPLGEAWEPFQRALDLDPENIHAMIHLARLASADGRTAELDTLAGRFVAASPDAARLLELRGLRTFGRDDRTEQAAIANLARDADDFVKMGLLQAATLFAQDLDATRSLVPAMTTAVRDPVTRETTFRMLTDIGLTGGKWSRDSLTTWLDGSVQQEWLLESEALVAAERFFPVPVGRVRALRERLAAERSYPPLARPRFTPVPESGGMMQRYLIALLDARLGDTVQARKGAAELLAVADPVRGAVARQLGHAILAELARTGGDDRRALEELEPFQHDLSADGAKLAHWGVRERFLRAEVLLGLRRDQEALRLYESFRNWSDLPFAAAAHLRSAQIEQRLGHPTRARFHYDRALSLWRNADPEFRPLVEGARQALAQLATKAARP